jgi:opacity protein-like surface antigen
MMTSRQSGYATLGAGRMVMKKHAAFAAFALLCLSATLLAQNINALTAQERAQGWQLLFDGKTIAARHVSAPAQAGTGTPPPPLPGQVGTPKPCVGRATPTPAGGSHWEVVDGLLIACGEPTGYLTSDRSYMNFVLSIEFKCAAETNSGVFVRSPQETGGYEVQIWRQQPAGYNTGAIVGTAKTARAYAFKAGQWNRYQITADGDDLIVELNGETTLDVHDAKFPEGQIRLQYQQFPIAFRNIKIRSLP